MRFSGFICSISKFIRLLSGVVLMALPAHAAPPQARLVHCGEATCLRLSGHRPYTVGTVRIGGHELAVEGGRNWSATVRLTTAQTWPKSADGALILAMFDARNSLEAEENVALPPGALGRRVELAMLEVRAR